MGIKEEYEAKKTAERARDQRKRTEDRLVADEAELSKKWFFNHPDKIVRYTGWLASYTLALFLATLLLFAAGIVTALILDRTDTATHTAALAVRDSADTAKLALIAAQRAFISVKFEPTSYKDIKDGKVHAYGFTPIWYNTGNTPTRNMENFINLKAIQKELADDWDFPNMWSAKTPVEKRTMTPLGASPKDTVRGQSVAANIDTIQDVIDGKKFLYFWGSATYNDVFPETKRHVTRFAVHVLIGGDPQDPERMSFRYDFLVKYNCSDEECDRLGFPADWKPRIVEIE